MPFSCPFLPFRVPGGQIFDDHRTVAVDVHHTSTYVLYVLTNDTIDRPRDLDSSGIARLIDFSARGLAPAEELQI
jgi:hypothetical protein